MHSLSRRSSLVHRLDLSAVLEAPHVLRNAGPLCQEVTCSVCYFPNRLVPMDPTKVYRKGGGAIKHTRVCVCVYASAVHT